MRSICSVLVVAFIVGTLPLHAQSAHVAAQAQLDAAVQEQVSGADRDRDTVRSFLERSEVKEIAGKAGIDLRGAETAVATLDPSDLALLGAKARSADEALAGGQSKVTISTTTIIIGLLVLILLIVALR